MKNSPSQKAKPVPSYKYNEIYFKTLNRGYEEFVKGSAFHPVFGRAIDLVGKIKGKKILDVGCGRGEFVRLCATKGALAFGIDYSAAAIKMARQMIKTSPVKNRRMMSFKRMEAKKIDYKDNFFDLVTMIDLVEHLYDWELEKVFDEAWRVLKPGGRLIVHTSPNKILIQPARALAKIFGKKLKSEEFHINEQSVFSLKKHLEKKFVIQTIQVDRETGFWSANCQNWNLAVRTIARTLDFFVDNSLSKFIIRITPLKIILGTSIWAVAKSQK